MSNRSYNILKYVAQIVLPALATLWVTVAGIWGLPYAEAISGTIMAVDLFLGALLKISSDKYFQTKTIIDKIISDQDPAQLEEE